VFAASAVRSFGEPVPTRGNIRVLTNLDAFTRAAADTDSNAILGFLASPGALGAVETAWPDDAPVVAVDETELRRGFCSRTIVRLVRHEYPGFYDGWSDARLERTVLEKHPEYRDRVCAVPAVLGVAPQDIVKYELQPRSAIANAALALWALVQTAAVAAAALFVYYRAVASYTGSRVRESA
jgi:hypothetical protein